MPDLPPPGPLHESFPRLAGLPVAVVGDAMLDRFVMGRVDRISPEAPVPVVEVREEEERLGGAANVAANVAALGARARLYCAVGPGEYGERLAARAGECGVDPGGLLECAGRLTTVKTRIIGGHQQIARIDRETRSPLAGPDRERLLARLREDGPFAAVIVSDYGKGVVGEELMALARGWVAAGVPVVVDPKQGNFGLYAGATCLTPNEREAAQAQHETIAGSEDALRVGEALRARLSAAMLLLTRGEHGMVLLREGQPAVELPTEARHVFDVTGAGDTVIATFTTALAAGADPADAARLANLAAGLVVAELGTAVPDPAALAAAWSR